MSTKWFRFSRLFLVLLLGVAPPAYAGVYAASGTIDANLAYKLTGNSSGTDFEIDLPSAGGRVDGFTASSVSSGSGSAVPAADTSQPQIMQFSGAVSDGASVATDANGYLRLRQTGEQQVGISVGGAMAGGAGLVLFRPQTFPNNNVISGTTNNPTSTSGSYATIPEMSTTLVSQGRNAAVLFSCGFDVHDGDSFTLAIFRDGTKVFERIVEFNGGVGALDPTANLKTPIIINVPLLGLTAGTTYTLTAQWAVVTGTGRAIGTGRFLFVTEV